MKWGVLVEWKPGLRPESVHGRAKAERTSRILWDILSSFPCSWREVPPELLEEGQASENCLLAMPYRGGDVPLSRLLADIRRAHVQVCELSKIEVLEGVSVTAEEKINIREQKLVKQE